MIQRFLLAAVGCLLTELSTSAAAGLFAPGTEVLLMIGSAIGIVLSALWLGRGLLLAGAGALAAAGWGLAAAHLWTQHASAFSLLAGQSAFHSIDGTAMFGLAAGCTGLAALCGWMLFHAREPWPVVALFGSCLLLRADVNATYADRFPFLAFGLLCLVGITFAGRAHVRGRVALASFVAALAVIVAWQLPTSIPAWSQSFVDPLRNLGTRSVPIAGQTTLSLSGPFEPRNRQVLSIALHGHFERPYWWEGIFDHYDGHSWQMTGYAVRRADVGSDLDPAGRKSVATPVTADVRALEGTNSLVFPGPPRSASIASLVMSQQSDGATLQVLTDGTLGPGSHYETHGIAAAPPPGSARAAPVPSTYLQLPTIPSRVKNLALYVAAGGGPLSKALRIQQFLSATGGYAYNTQVGSPSYEDAADYFLFVSRQGYCNQFATAMAVLLREVGVPSRIVSGFVGGTVVGGRYIVKEKDAHSWVQAFLPGRGWADFEPTPGFSLDPGMTVSSVPHPATQPGSTTKPATVTVPRAHPTRVVVVPPRPVTGVGPLPRRSSPPPFPWPLVALALAGMVAALALLRRPRSASALYRLMVRSRRLWSRPRPGETPHEFTERAFSRPGTRRHASLITDLYVVERYGGRRLEPSELDQARAAWRALRLRRLAPWLRS